MFVVNLIGLGFGSTAIALFTDHVLGDPALIRYSLMVVPPVALLISGTLFWLALKPYRNSLDTLTSELPDES